MDLLEKIDSKIDKIQETLQDVKIEHAVQTEHIKKNTKDLEDHIEGVKQNRARIEHLEKSEAKVGMIWKVLTAVFALVAVVSSVSRMFGS